MHPVHAHERGASCAEGGALGVGVLERSHLGEAQRQRLEGGLGRLVRLKVRVRVYGQGLGLGLRPGLGLGLGLGLGRGFKADLRASKVPTPRTECPGRGSFRATASTAPRCSSVSPSPSHLSRKRAPHRRSCAWPSADPTGRWADSGHPEAALRSRLRGATWLEPGKASHPLEPDDSVLHIGSHPRVWTTHSHRPGSAATAATRSAPCWCSIARAQSMRGSAAVLSGSAGVALRRE